MKNCRIFLSAAFIMLLTSCSIGGDYLETSYSIIETSFKPQSLRDSYRVTFNGEESPYIKKSNETVKLEVFPKEGNMSIPILSEDNWPVSEPIVFVLPVGQDLSIYSEEKYQVFNPSIIYSGDEAQYSVLFEGAEMKIGNDNYIAKSELPGDFVIKDKTSNIELYSQELTAESPSLFSIIQLAGNEFLPINDDPNEADPEAGKFKVRFLYTADAFPDYPEMKLVLYLVSTDWAQYSDAVSTITLKAGELSEYVVVDGDYFGMKYVYGLYDLVDPNDESYYIVNNMTDMETLIDLYTCGAKYKFSTVRFTDPNHLEHNGVLATSIVELCTPW